MPFPDDWPVFAPKDKIGDWLEMYTKVMELNYWGSTTAKKARFDEAKKEWNVVVERDGREITLRPKQLVLAPGVSGKPNLPKIPGAETFEGEQHHSSAHPGPEAWRGKKCVVMGSNNSAHDICAALWENGADVTMIQRSFDPHRALRFADGAGARRALFRAGGEGRRHDRQGRPDLRLAALQDHGADATCRCTTR